MYVVGPLLQDDFLFRSCWKIEVIGDVALLQFCCLVIMQEEVIETLDLSVILECNYFLIEFIEQQSAILHNSSIVGCFEGEERVELLDQDRNENVSDIWLRTELLNF
jgi:hypothetical protein